MFEWRKSVHYWWSYILFSPECKELTSMLDPLLYRWGVPPIVIRCVHWTMQMGVLQTWIKAQDIVIVMKRQLSPDGDQLTVDNDINGATKRYKDGLPDSCTNSSDDGYYDLDSPETGRVTVSPRLLRSREVLEHGQATSSPALTSLRDLVRNQIWHLSPDKAKKPTACQTINPGSGSKRKVKDTVNLAPNPVKIAKRLKALPDEDFNQITLHTGDLKGLGSDPAEIIGPRKIIRKLAGRHVYLSPTESIGQRAVALSPKEFATMIHTYGQAGIDKSPPREIHITTPPDRTTPPREVPQVNEVHDPIDPPGPTPPV